MTVTAFILLCQSPVITICTTMPKNPKTHDLQLPLDQHLMSPVKAHCFLAPVMIFFKLLLTFVNHSMILFFKIKKLGHGLKFHLNKLSSMLYNLSVDIANFRNNFGVYSPLFPLQSHFLMSCRHFLGMINVNLTLSMVCQNLLPQTSALR